MKIVIHRPDGDPTWVEHRANAGHLSGDIVVMEKAEFVEWLRQLSVECGLTGLSFTGQAVYKRINDLNAQLTKVP
jgi:hypothetical protein